VLRLLLFLLHCLQVLLCLLLLLQRCNDGLSCCLTLRERQLGACLHDKDVSKCCYTGDMPMSDGMSCALAPLLHK
jgi:hypothetical protein